MGLLAPLVRPFRRSGKGAQSSAPPPATPQHGKHKTEGLRCWLQQWQLPLRRTGGVQKVTVTADHYLGFSAIDSGYGSENSSQHNVTAVEPLNPATSTSSHYYSLSSPPKTSKSTSPPKTSSPPTTASSDATTLVNPSVSPTNGTVTGQEAVPTELKRTLGSLAKAAINCECPEAYSTIQHIKLLQQVATQQPVWKNQWDPPLVWNGQTFRFSQIGRIGKDWIDRFDLAQKIYKLTEQQLIHPEDMEDLVNWMFAEEESHVLPVIIGRLIVNNLVDEGCLTRVEGNRLAALALTIDEVKDCGDVVERTNKHLREEAALGVFKQLPLLKNKDRTRALLHLAEAAAYCVSEHAGGVWYGIRYLDARTDIKRYIKACEGAQKGHVPSELVKYARTWTDQETRILQRSQFIMDLLDRWDAGKINDFGVIKYTRNSFFPYYHQPRGNQETLANILYNKVEGSGMDCEEVPKIVALLPHYDNFHAAGGQRWIDLKSKLAAELMEHKQLNEQLIEEHKIAKKAYKAYLKGEGKKLAGASKKYFRHSL